jgi:predicted RNA-binding protein with PIN domain
VAAIDALAGADGIVVVIDGHNLLGAMDASTMATGRARRTLITSLGRLVRHLGSSSVEVVFDSVLRDGRPVATSDDGVVIRFAPEELIADDVIVGLAAEHGVATVVISDDREVRERSSRYRATTLWAQALAAWL